jgi:hypothetical protein
VLPDAPPWIHAEGVSAPDLTGCGGDEFELAPLVVHGQQVEKEGCRDCTWRYWCSGGCAVATFKATGRYDIKSPNCNIYKAIYPQALRLEGLRLLKYATHVVSGMPPASR